MSGSATEPAANRVQQAPLAPPPPAADPTTQGAGKDTQEGKGTEKDEQNRPKTPEEEMKALLQSLSQASAGLGQDNAILQFTVSRLVMAAEANPATMAKKAYRRDVAYAVQDVERVAGKPVMADGPLATEMRQLATSLPGLDSMPMRDLLKATGSIADQILVQDIRNVASGMTAAGKGHSGPSFASAVNSLEARYETQRLSHGASPTFHQNSAKVEDAPPLASMPSSPTPQQTHPQSDRRAAAPSQPDQAKQAPPQANAGQANAQPADAVAGQAPQSAVMSIMKRLRAPVPTGAETVYPPPAASVASRVAAFEARIAEGKTNGMIEYAEKSGLRAMQAMQQFVQGPGRGVLGKMEAAASTEPGGMQTVMQEMRPGGRYANLRTGFDNAYQQDQAFKQSYDTMIDRTAQFGRDRQAVTDNFQQRGLDPANLDGRFAKAEEALGENLAKTPGKQAGKSALDELSEKIAEVLKSAFERTKQIFQPGMKADRNPSPSPSPSP